ncbi:hypothetical protein D3C79_1115050 [compost metagenome]
MTIPTFCGSASAQNASSKASHKGRKISMNCGSGDTLSNMPMANVSQTIQPFREAVAPTIILVPW